MIQFALREIKNSRRFSLFFIFNLSLGLAGFLSLDILESSLRSTIGAQSKFLAGGDLVISTRRDLNENERQIIAQKLGAQTQQTKLIDFFSMISFGQATRLVQLRAITEGFPLYGDLTLQKGEVISSKSALEVSTEQKVWIYPELQSQLGLKIGDKLQIGKAEFTVSNIIEKDAGGSFRRFSIAPRVYIGQGQLEKTGLVRFGATISYTYLYRLPNDNVDPLVADLNQALADPQIEAVSHTTASDQTGRMLSYLNDFLGLVGLVGLFLSGLGSAYLFRSFLSRRLKDMAVLMTLGLTRREIQRVYLWQMAFLGAAAGFVGLVASYLLLPVLIQLVKQLTPIEIFIFFDPMSVVVTVGLGILTSVLVGLPLLARIQTLKAAELFREDYQPQGTITRRAFYYFVPLLIAFWILAVWQANSFKIGSTFVGSFWGSAVLLGLLSYFGLKLLSRVSVAGVTLKLPIRSLARNRLSTASCFLALGLGSLLLNLIPQLQTSLQAELQSPDRILPSLFLFDIQEEQLTDVQNVLKQENLDLTYLSPLVRARIESVNGKPFEKIFEPGRALTREQEQEERSRNRGYNLTYRPQLSESEELVSGKLFSDKAGEVAEISVEERFADRLNFKLGDILKFDIQGVEIEGRIVNTRRVRWTSFQPNFFVVFQPGFLEQAPKTFLASVGKVSDEVKNRLQLGIVQKASNVSIIDVERLIENILKIANQMSWALKFMALLSIFSGMVVLFSIANHQARLRRWDLNLMKTLGAGLNDLYKMVAIEFGLLAFSAAVCGGSVSLLVSYGIARLLFDGSYDFSFALIFYSAIGTTIMAVVVALLASRKTLNLKPLDLLGTGPRN